MSAIALRRLGSIVAFVLQNAMLRAVFPPNPDEVPARPSLAGQLLVAAPSIGDPHFERAVILIVQHSPSGALGIVINKPIGQTSIATLFRGRLAKRAARSQATCACSRAARYSRK
jgi:putative transcriptional regulator